MAFEEYEEKTSPTGTEVMAAQARSRREIIARVAYQLAAKRGFSPGHELDDWLAAERQREAWERGCGRILTGRESSKPSSKRYHRLLVAQQRRGET